MKKKFLLLLGLLIFLGLNSCDSETNRVPSLTENPMPDAIDEAQDEEALVMEFAECLRDEGMDIIDPSVDIDGNIQLPELVEGAMVTKEEWNEAYDVCGEIIKDITFEKRGVDRSEQLEEYIELAGCLQDQGFDIIEPTAETLITWMADLKNILDLDDPDTQEAFEGCMGGDLGGGWKNNGGK
jgi:hypothetical protein